MDDGKIIHEWFFHHPQYKHVISIISILISVEIIGMWRGLCWSLWHSGRCILCGACRILVWSRSICIICLTKLYIWRISNIYQTDITFAIFPSKTSVEILIWHFINQRELSQRDPSDESSSFSNTISRVANTRLIHTERFDSIYRTLSMRRFIRTSPRLLSTIYILGLDTADVYTQLRGI